MSIYIGHEVRIQWLDFYDRFQIAAVPDSDRIGKSRPAIIFVVAHDRP